MALIRWGNESDWLDEFDRMQREMETLRKSFRPGEQAWRGRRASVYPPLNIYHDGETFIVRAEVPGIDPASIDLQVAGNTLTLRGERVAPELGGGSSYHRRERDFGSFRRSFTLPEQVDNSKVMAKCKDGILEIYLPYAHEAKQRKIKVQST